MLLSTSDDWVDSAALETWDSLAGGSTELLSAFCLQPLKNIKPAIADKSSMRVNLVVHLFVHLFKQSLPSFHELIG